MRKYFSLLGLLTAAAILSYGQANTTLSNLTAPTGVNQSLVPNNNGNDLGSGAKSWRILFIDSSVYLKDILFMHSKGTQNTFIGALAGNGITTGKNNAAFGYHALNANKGNSFNSAFGSLALSSNTASNNSAFGYNALGLNTSGTGNVATGTSALYKNTTGSYNTAFGYQALYSNTTVGINTAIGYQTLYSNTTGNPNTAVGHQALYSNTTGNENTAIGQTALYYNTTGYQNTAVGRGALYQNTTAADNTAIGFKSLFSNVDGYGNTATGSQALVSNISGSSNTADGYQALYSNKQSDNTAIGYRALYSNTYGYENTANGDRSLYSNTGGIYNTANGCDALYSNISGIYNTAIGYRALLDNATGSYNTALGYGTDVYLDNSNDNTIIGALAGVEGSNSTVIGYQAYTNGSNVALLGNTTTLFCGGYVNWTNYFSDARLKTNVKENVKGLDFIMRLRPVTYHINIEALYKLQGRSSYGNAVDKMTDAMKAEKDKNISAKEAVNMSGFIAQEVEKAAQESGYDFDGIKKPQNDKDNYGLSYATFVVPLVKAVQELDIKTQEIDALKIQLQEQGEEIHELKQLVQTLIQTKSLSTSDSYLGQNIPNPSNSSTVIPFQIAKGSHSAIIQITQTGSGKIIKTIPVDIKATQVSLNTNSLAAGSYLYSLIVDGKIADSKHMTLIGK